MLTVLINSTMDIETTQLLEAISRMNNLYGFCARHFISSKQDHEKFIADVYKAIKESKVNADPELIEQLEIFFRKN